ncbi:MAG: glycosyltransferase family 61 protein [Lachnospiraceae bacterium]|nr:glycosyltransferase family 61 protein [Lachnospiraceae bacterium]
MRIEYKYLRPKKAAALKELHEHSLVEKKELSIESFSHATFLPLKHFGEEEGLLFGRGGLLNAEGSFIEASGIEKRYGGIYEHETPAERDERVLYCGYLSFGWGHFLLESVSRLWPVVTGAAPEVDKYVFVGNAGGGTSVGGNFREFLELLGIWDKVELLDAPARFREVLLPQLSYSFLHYHTPQYNAIFDRVIRAAVHGSAASDAEGQERNISGSRKETSPRDEAGSGAGSVLASRAGSCEETRKEICSRKLFLSRRHVYDKKHWYGGTRPRERGLDMLDEYFSSNGYRIIYPERTSLRELIPLMHDAEVVAVESGSCAHNTLLVPSGAKVQIIERQAYVNDYQANIDVIRDLNAEYVDAHYSLYPVEAFGGPCLIMNTAELQRFTADHGMTPPPERFNSSSYYRRSIRWYLWLYRHLMGERIMMDESLLPQAEVFLETSDATYEVFRPYLETKRRQRAFRLWERIGYPRF